MVPGWWARLLVGLTYAKSLSFATGVPLIAVNHIEGHIHAVILECSPVELPALALVVSGGHTHLFEVREGFQYRLLGKTRDDAAGEAFDKVGQTAGLRLSRRARWWTNWLRSAILARFVSPSPK